METVLLAPSNAHFETQHKCDPKEGMEVLYRRYLILRLEMAVVEGI